MSVQSSTPVRAQPELPTRPRPGRSGPGAVRDRRSGARGSGPVQVEHRLTAPQRMAILQLEQQRRVTGCDRASRLRRSHAIDGNRGPHKSMDNATHAIARPIKAALIATTRAALNLEARGLGSDRPDHPPFPVNVGQVSFPSPATPAAARVLEGRPGPASEAARRLVEAPV
jgi:hypothetical protein